MQRPIKFRVWDKINKKIYYHVGFSPHGVQVYKDDGFSEEVILDCGRNCFEIMQYTGLLDKNGKEVWEGDLLHQAGTKSNKYGKKLEVFWRDEIGGWYPFIHDKKRYETKYEVIGNIYVRTEV